MIAKFDLDTLRKMADFLVPELDNFGYKYEKLVVKFKRFPKGTDFTKTITTENERGILTRLAETLSKPHSVGYEQDALLDTYKLIDSLDNPEK